MRKIVFYTAAERQLLANTVRSVVDDWQQEWLQGVLEVSVSVDNKPADSQPSACFVCKDASRWREHLGFSDAIERDLVSDVIHSATAQLQNTLMQVLDTRYGVCSEKVSAETENFGQIQLRIDSDLFTDSRCIRLQNLRKPVHAARLATVNIAQSVASLPITVSAYLNATTVTLEDLDRKSVV